VRALVAALALLPDVLAAQDLAGRWGLEGTTGCDSGLESVQVAPEGEGLRLDFHESSCLYAAGRESTDFPGLLVRDGTCRGEGTEWPVTLLAFLDPWDRLVLLRQDETEALALIYGRCE
jgi:hypothetical protein